eukprot:gi/632936913/ref/XP_007896580.1/ PREDICTED: leucine-rich repeat, immunoglobulin-like domain and transmembrane domain-containing protein 2 [Callorhinchus milii]
MTSALRRIPLNIPRDVKKIRIENSHLTELPRSAFSTASALEYLWLNLNDITLMHARSLQDLSNLAELRLQGNKLRSVPWATFQDTPALNILDLKHNRLDVLPEQALRYLANLTYLDLSFNQLTVISGEVFLKWPVYQRTQRHRDGEETVPNAVLALNDNPWLCDCRLKGFVHFVKSINPPIILMNSYLTCSGPDIRAGKFFHEVELKSCFKPTATSENANVSVQIGEHVNLSCVVKGNPIPAVWWTNGMRIIRKFNVSVIHIDEETVKSELVFPSTHGSDGGRYICMTTNYLGNSSVQILLKILTPAALFPIPSLSPSSAEENVYIDIRIAKQTIYGIILEWYAATRNPADTWYTLHFGKFEDAKKEMIYIGPGVNTYAVNDLFPATKYKVCVTLRNQSPKKGQCIVFVTGNDISELEQREKLIHIIVIVCAMVLAVPAGMYACTSETRFSCFENCGKRFKRQRRGERTLKTGERDAAFDSLQTASDAELCKRNSKEDKRRRKKSEDKVHKAKAEHKNSDELY